MAGRGRPPAPTPHLGGGRVGCEDRIAWLLRTNRVYGGDASLAIGANFAAELHVDPARVTRWERAALTAGYPVLRRYERVLGLRRYSLVSVADLVYRETRGSAGRSHLDRGLDGASPLVRRRTETLLDKTLGGDIMTGADWDELTAALWAVPNLLLYPSSLWNDIADRLLAEMIIADGPGWLLRSEALSRLLGHPTGEPYVIAACAALIGDSTNQVFIEPLTFLEASPHPDAARNIIGQVVNPTNDLAFRGAWWSVAAKVGNGHFTPGETDLLIRQAIGLLEADTQHPSCRLAAAELLRQTASTLPSSSTLAPAVRRIVAADRMSRQILGTGRTAASETTHAITERVSAAAIRHMPRDVLDSDPMLAVLLDDMLFHPQISVRFVALHLVAATPYRTPLARAIAAELRNRTLLEDPAIGPAMVAAMAQLGDATTRPFLEELALSPGIAQHAAETAVWAIGHARGVSDDAFWVGAMQRHRADSGRARGIVYSLGIRRNMSLLQRFRADPSLPGGVRRAAAWWLNLPRYVLDSTYCDSEWAMQ